MEDHKMKKSNPRGNQKRRKNTKADIKKLTCQAHRSGGNRKQYNGNSSKLNYKKVESK